MRNKTNKSGNLEIRTFGAVALREGMQFASPLCGTQAARTPTLRRFRNVDRHMAQGAGQNVRALQQWESERSTRDKLSRVDHVEHILDMVPANGELRAKATVASYATVQSAGGREVDFYNLDVIKLPDETSPVIQHFAEAVTNTRKLVATRKKEGKDAS